MRCTRGFVEPVESTVLHLIMAAVLRLMRMFPHSLTQRSCVTEYNRQTREEMERIRDFIILHYKATQRSDSPFWRYCAGLEIPDTLAHRIDLFRESGRSWITETELFRVDSWTQVMIDQGVTPEHYHQIVDTMGDEELGRFPNTLHTQVQQQVDRMPSQQAFIDQYCKAPNIE